MLIPVYGNDSIRSERPFKAVLKRDVWIVTGSVPCHNPPRGAPCAREEPQKSGYRKGRHRFSL